MSRCFQLFGSNRIPGRALPYSGTLSVHLADSMPNKRPKYSRDFCQNQPQQHHLDHQSRRGFPSPDFPTTSDSILYPSHLTPITTFPPYPYPYPYHSNSESSSHYPPHPSQRDQQSYYSESWGTSWSDHPSSNYQRSDYTSSWQNHSSRQYYQGPHQTHYSSNQSEDPHSQGSYYRPPSHRYPTRYSDRYNQHSQVQHRNKPVAYHHEMYRPQQRDEYQDRGAAADFPEQRQTTSSTYSMQSSRSPARHDTSAQSIEMKLAQTSLGTPRTYSTYAKVPTATRSEPRQSYLDQASSKPETIDGDDTKRLLVLDLNGTLVFRKKNKSSMAQSSASPTPRPYLDCFLQYGLGISSFQSTTADEADKVVNPSIAQDVTHPNPPHGSHFWPGGQDSGQAIEPKSPGQCEVVVWSSAQPKNVDAMVYATFSEEQRAQLLRVWARDTLVAKKFYYQKVESIKDLEIVWAELNAWQNGQPSPDRLMAEAREIADGKRPELQNTVSASLEAALEAEELGPWGPHNTLLLDDSKDKARLQPYNHVCIPEFDAEAANLMDRYIVQQKSQIKQEEEEEEDDESNSDSSDNSQHSDKNGETKVTDNEVKISSLDDVLLQTIGVLEIMKTQKNVSAFIRSGALKHFGTYQGEQQKEIEGTREYWAHHGREACKKLGIKVQP